MTPLPGFDIFRPDARFAVQHKPRGEGWRTLGTLGTLPAATAWLRRLERGTGGEFRLRYPPRFLVTREKEAAHE